MDIQRVPTDADVTGWLGPVLDEMNVTGEAAEYARRLVSSAWAKRDQYDSMISEVTDHWEVSRMAVVDRNVLRLALYELIEQPDVPARVVIDEAIEIGREFGDAETPQFVNGVLDAIWKKHPACRTARGEPA